MKLPVTARFLSFGALLFGLGLSGCGGPAGLPDLSGLNLGSGNSGNNNSSNSGNNNSGGSGDSSGGGTTDKLIDDLLGGIGGGNAPSGNSPSIPPSSTPSAPTGGGGGSSSGGKLDTFDEDIARIRQIVPGWDNGTGLTVKFLRERDQQRLSLIYVDATPPVLKEGVNLWMIQAKAKGDNKTLGWFVILLKDLAPGRYSGSPTNRDVIMAALMAPEWDGKNPETTWSINDGSWCEITLRNAGAPGDLEGEFRGKLVDNKGSGYHTVENGYIYINR